MWRSFVNSFTSNTYENYLKRHLAADQQPKSKKKQTASESASREAEKMSQDYLALQRKVQEQRKIIKETDDMQEVRRKMKIHKENEIRLLEKDRKNSFMQKIRSYSNNKAKKQRVFEDLTKEIRDPAKDKQEEVKDTFFTSLRPSSPIKVFAKSSTRMNSKRNTVNLKEYQEKVMKEFKKTLPKDYYDQLESEFFKIRKKSEETFEQYKLSKKLKKSNPYDIRPKTRACSNIDILFN